MGPIRRSSSLATSTPYTPSAFTAITTHTTTTTTSPSPASTQEAVVATEHTLNPTVTTTITTTTSAVGHSGNASVTYAALIALAIELSEDKRLVLDDIYKFVEKHRCLVPVKSHPNWKNSVRHNLSLRPCFVKVPRYNSSGKAMSAWWTLDTTCLPKAAKEAVERARKFTDGSNQTQTTDQFVREVLTVDDHPTTSHSPLSSSDSQDNMSSDAVPDAYATEVTPTPPYTLSSSNAFLFDNGTTTSSSDEEFAMVPSRSLSPPHLYFPEPEPEAQFPDYQMAVYPNEYDMKYGHSQNLFPDITLPSPFSKSSFAFSDLLFAP